MTIQIRVSVAVLLRCIQLLKNSMPCLKQKWPKVNVVGIIVPCIYLTLANCN